MAPANPPDGCRLPTDRQRSPSIPPSGRLSPSTTISVSKEPKTPKITTVASEFKLNIGSANSPSSNPVLAPPCSSPTHCQPGQMEIEEIPAKYSKITRPKHDIKSCIQSYQSLPPKTRQTLRLAAIIIASILALLAIFYVARLAEQYENHGQKVILEHEMQEKFHVTLDPGPFLYEPKNHQLEYQVDHEPANNEEPRMLFKVGKDENGKAQMYDKFLRRGIPVFPGYRDIAREEYEYKRTSKKRPANSTEIARTLDLVRKRVDADRKKISSKELRFWEPTSEPLRILLVSTWRSGSTFLGQIIETHPGVFQHYEPLSYLGVTQVRSGKEAFQSQQLLHRLLDCKFQGLDSYINQTKRNPTDLIGHNVRIYEPCKEGPNSMACFNEDFLSESCKLFPIQLVKTVRLRLNLTQLLLNDEKLRVKVLFLVRDPRGIMSSRYSSVQWCSSSPDCSSPDALCQDLQGDLKVAAAFEQLYPDRFLKVRYEDLAGNVEDEVAKILQFLGLEFTQDIKDFLKENTEKDDNGKPWSIRRKSADRIALWKKQLPLQEIHAVQNVCESVLKSLKYEMLGA